MLPSILAKQLQRGIGDYIRTTFPMANEPFKGSVDEMLADHTSLYHEPYLAVRLPFRTADAMPTCFEAIHPEFLPYVHQQRAYERLVGEDGASTLIATGTGSGKTECFLYPILEYCYRHRGEPGIKALIIYPMNALASDQAKRIAELVNNSPELNGNVRAGMYVGGREENASKTMSESRVITDRETMLNNPPDILMTNYKMLDYLLVRPKDADLWKDNNPTTLKYVAVDELHTFDGAQGTDLACLLRRVKARLNTLPGYLCCIGTSATMGAEDSAAGMRKYAAEIFGEVFPEDSVITEDRLSAEEYLSGSEIEYFTVPDPEQTAGFKEKMEESDEPGYLSLAAAAWFPEYTQDVMSDDGRIALGQMLMQHSFFQTVIRYTGGKYYQASSIMEELVVQYPDLKYSNQETVIDSLYALISHARTGAPGKLRPFLNVQVQLWMRELRRLLARVNGEEINYAISNDLNAQQAKEYLPVVNCRDCGATGWVSLRNERGNVRLGSLPAFYNAYFRGDDNVALMYPNHGKTSQAGMYQAELCPDCMQLTEGEELKEECGCGGKTIPVLVPIKPPAHKINSGTTAQYECPFCGSRRGLSLMGLRGATEISANLSQMFATGFNDDKKALAFSDNVQDAAHRAGFFNARTWRFGLRTAIQHYCDAEGAGKSLSEFQEGFCAYWHTHMSREAFVSSFIGPNMTWIKSYENMLEQRRLADSQQAKQLVEDVEKRVRYEIMLEYGVAATTGRTLEKSGCSVLSFPNELICRAAELVRELTVNELGILKYQSIVVFRTMVLEYLHTMKSLGAFNVPILQEFVLDNANRYKLSNDWKRWLPGLGNLYMPHFPVRAGAGTRRREYLEDYDGNRYLKLIDRCIAMDYMIGAANMSQICEYIIRGLTENGLIQAMPSPVGCTVYGINPDKVYISNEVVPMHCTVCNQTTVFSGENVELLEGAGCLRNGCPGVLEESADSALDYYGRLYRVGDLARINAREHTGLLERDDRELLENDFKRKKDDRQIWDPNVLSCTPTLEMGIDIGDLSTVILCSMPPAQAQFLQRTGRAGRKDGNALTLAIANAKPHDLYFYADPMEMISGEVEPPKIFLKASAVLERQLIAYCMDNWVRSGIKENDIPAKVSPVFGYLDRRPKDKFPFNFLSYTKARIGYLQRMFFSMFQNDFDDTVRNELKEFTKPGDNGVSTMEKRIIDAFDSLRQQDKALLNQISELKKAQAELEAKPQDSSYQEEIDEIKKEIRALTDVRKSLRDKTTFNFLSDEGILPNYAFPEAGIVLRAVLSRKNDDNAQDVPQAFQKKYEKTVYEYNRAAASAISEFAPNNSFYVDGRKLTIDQVDLTTSKPAKWRICPNCAHAQLEESGKDAANCPNCKSAEWAGAEQVRSMLKVQMVYSNADYNKSLIGDDSEDRTNIFYNKQMLVDVDEAHDIISAYEMKGLAFPFGYEFVSKASMREINFGEESAVGTRMMVAGEEAVRKGFKICSGCGKIQIEGKQEKHSYACKFRKKTEQERADAFEDCLFLYREFQTEALRILIPATTLDSTTVKAESFTAAFMLGMKKHFGNVDHLRATVCEIPVQDAAYRKKYLVVYDSVPGGTGYLKQLMLNEGELMQIFEQALTAMKECSCKDDPKKDGCYHCLYAYRQSQQIGNISRNAAIQMLETIVAGKDKIEKIDTISGIKTDHLVDSELEQMFLDAVYSKVGSGNMPEYYFGGKRSYHVMIGGNAWDLELQVDLGPEDGVVTPCRPDFVLRPVTERGKKKPVAVFTDGYQYHEKIAADDTHKREAIRRSGRYRVWSLTYKDVEAVSYHVGDFATPVLTPMSMPNGAKAYNLYLEYPDALKLDKISAFDLLMFYLRNPDAEAILQNRALALSYSLLNVKESKNPRAFAAWLKVFDNAKDQTSFTELNPIPGKTIIGTWVPSSVGACLRIYAGVSAVEYQKDRKTPVSVCAVLTDGTDERTDRYKEELNGMWHFANIMQFAPIFMAMSTEGLKNGIYADLMSADTVEQSIVAPVAVAKQSAEEMQTVRAEQPAEISDEWQAIIDDSTFSKEIRELAAAAAAAGLPAPDEDDIGADIMKDGTSVAALDLQWPDRKIAYVDQDHLSSKTVLEELGWKILTIDHLDASLFGGEA